MVGFDNVLAVTKRIDITSLLILLVSITALLVLLMWWGVREKGRGN